MPNATKERRSLSQNSNPRGARRPGGGQAWRAAINCIFWVRTLRLPVKISLLVIFELFDVLVYVGFGHFLVCNTISVLIHMCMSRDVLRCNTSGWFFFEV